MINLKKYNVVFIADYISEHKNITLENSDLECVDSDYYNSVLQVLQKLCKNVFTYREIDNFIDNIKSHENDIVLSLYSGNKSRNRKALIPSICEAYNLCYVGASPYVHIVSADKHLAKKYCKDFDVFGAKDILVDNPNKTHLLETLKYPLFVKPNFEGGSNGISKMNLVKDETEAIRVINQLHLHFKDSIIVEEFIKGKEITVIMATIDDKTHIIGENLLKPVNNNNNNERDLIFGYESKKENHLFEKEKVSYLSSKEKNNFIKLYNSFDKVGIMRIDGKIFENNFYLIEISPDCSISMQSSVYNAYKNMGISYKKMIAMLLEEAISHHLNQNANMK